VGFLLAAAIFAGCRERESATPRLTVFVAASMGDVVEELVDAYTAKTGADVQVSAAATGILRKQVESGADCDVFLAADAVELDKLEKAGLIVADTRCVVARNQLVVIACGDKPPALHGLKALAKPETGRVAIGDPSYVPAGRYAKRALEHANVWEAVEPRAVFADNVRVVCQYVRSRQADVGLVYATDAALMPDCRVRARVDESMSGPIVCPGAVCAHTKDTATAERLLEFLTAPEQAKVWQRYGFHGTANADDGSE